jgi:hypothetical protein
MPLPDSVQQKLYRAGCHFDELNLELETYYQSDPGALISERLPDASTQWVFREKQPVPARMGLIFGDCIQNMRSALDYLVWELVLATGNEPSRRNMFPICLKETDYQSQIQNWKRLQGVDPRAATVIEAVQPYLFTEDQREICSLAVLDDLNNINKHRRVLYTTLGSFVDQEPSVPAMFYTQTDLSGIDFDGKRKNAERIRAFVTLQDGSVKGLEIATCLNAIALYISQQLLPLFEEFFE